MRNNQSWSSIYFTYWFIFLYIGLMYTCTPGILREAISVNWTSSLGVTPEALRANIDWKSAFSLQQGQFDPKFQVEGGRPHQPFFLTENEDERSFMWYKNVGTSFFRFVTMHAFDRQTDGQTHRKVLEILCVALHAVAR